MTTRMIMIRPSSCCRTSKQPLSSSLSLLLSSSSVSSSLSATAAASLEKRSAKRIMSTMTNNAKRTSSFTTSSQGAVVPFRTRSLFQAKKTLVSSLPCFLDRVELQHRYFASSSGSGSDDEHKKKEEKEGKSGSGSSAHSEEEEEEAVNIRTLPTKEDEEEEEEIPEPSSEDLKLVALTQAIPFVGFGIMDNAILILAGDAIDTSLGVTLGISTLCAAAIGNIISDLAGVVLGTAIEDFAAKLNIPTPNISAAQRMLRSVRFAGQAGCAVGITIGCIIGMFPLFFLDTNKSTKQKKEAHMDSIFRDVMTEAKHLIGSEQTRLFLVVDSPTSTTLPHSSSTDSSGTTKKKTKLADSYLYCKYIDEDDVVEENEDSAVVATTSAANDIKNVNQIRKRMTNNSSLSDNKSLYLPVGKGIVSRAVLTGEAVNIYDARTEPDYVQEENILYKDSNDHAGGEGVKSMICVPVFDLHGNVIAVIQALNKVSEGSIANEKEVGIKRSGFTSNDVQVLQALASHVSVSLQDVDEEDVQTSLKGTIQILKEQGTSGLSDHHDMSSSAGYSRRRPLFPEIDDEPMMEQRSGLATAAAF